MKIKRLTAIVLVAVMALSAVLLSSCGGKVVSKVHVKFVTTVEPDGTKLDEDKTIGEIDVEVEGTKKNPPTVLKAAQLALTELSYEDGFETTPDGYSIARVSKYAEHQETDETTGYFTYWDAYIDGARSTDGRQSETVIYSGQELEFRFISSSQAREDHNYVD